MRLAQVLKFFWVTDVFKKRAVAEDKAFYYSRSFKWSDHTALILIDCNAFKDRQIRF